MIDICIHGEINIVRVEEQKNILIIYLKDILSTDKYFIWIYFSPFFY